MGPGLLALRYAVTMATADTFIIWRLILLIRDADSVSVCWMNACGVCVGPKSSASLSWWPMIIRAPVNSGSAAATKRSPAPSRWELIFRCFNPNGVLIAPPAYIAQASPNDLYMRRIGSLTRGRTTAHDVEALFRRGHSRASRSDGFIWYYALPVYNPFEEQGGGRR